MNGHHIIKHTLILLLLKNILLLVHTSLFLITEMRVPWRLLKHPNPHSHVSLFLCNTPPTKWSGCGHYGKWHSKPAPQSVGRLKCAVPGFFTNPHHFFFLLFVSICWRIMGNRMLLAAVIGVVQSFLFGLMIMADETCKRIERWFIVINI